MMKAIGRFDGLYSASKNGRIWSHISDRYLAKRPTTLGYLQIKVKEKEYLVHRLIAETFLPNPFGLKEVNHRNGNRSDNRLKNLEWCTHQQNLLMAYKVTTLTEEKMQLCRILLKTGDFGQNDIKKLLKVSQSSLRQALRKISG